MDHKSRLPSSFASHQAYSSRAIRAHPCRRGIRAVTPTPADQRPHRLRRGGRGGRGGRPPAFERQARKLRNTVERHINRLKLWRDLAARYDKTATICLAGMDIAGTFLRSAR
ncbi:IS5 family transposase [Mangrovactinospora gilvigrisea]|uniref:IS5 family transposase n=1 Tax=Mangrovactinospora gilvigrisea TaxID=1428644 RepID=A0A1J7BLA2_9ACTN|nr:IS5 family transposase [Mangrovactinospora gilvigrisea]